ncbi:MAG: HAD family hydrolase [Clostridiales bacterium]|nr:HAD family hydrolase [Clostridiales bacterium]
MKELYISDLDGTLLNNSAVVSERSAALLNRAIEEKDIYFSVATARTAATTVSLVSKINVNAPVVLMNGVSIYDISKGEYVKVNVIERSACEKAMEILSKHSLSGFWYSIRGGRLSTYYDKIQNEEARKFMNERVFRFKKIFTHVDHIEDCLRYPLVLFSLMDKKEVLEDAAEEMKKVEGLRAEFFSDTYIDGYWYLEICSSEASKSNAVKFLRSEYGFDKITAFGDNLNDIPMFKECDFSCAMENAVDEAKKYADVIIGNNDDDGVAKWIAENA